MPPTLNVYPLFVIVITFVPWLAVIVTCGVSAGSFREQPLDMITAVNKALTVMVDRIFIDQTRISKFVRDDGAFRYRFIFMTAATLVAALVFCTRAEDRKMKVPRRTPKKSQMNQTQ
jgi:hypothetical protein